MKLIARCAVTLAAAAALAACGGGDDAGGTAGDGGGGGGGATELTLVDNEFRPAKLTVSSGAELELVNEGETIHNLTVTGIDTDVEAGENGSVTVGLDPGTYDMICKYHEAQGMTGKLTVQ